MAKSQPATSGRLSIETKMTTTKFENASVPGRGRQLTAAQEQILIQLFQANSNDTPDPAKHTKKFWILLSHLVSESIGRQYSWQSCRRHVTRHHADLEKKFRESGAHEDGVSPEEAVNFAKFPAPASCITKTQSTRHHQRSQTRSLSPHVHIDEGQKYRKRLRQFSGSSQFEGELHLEDSESSDPDSTTISLPPMPRRPMKRRTAEGLGAATPRSDRAEQRQSSKAQRDEHQRMQHTERRNTSYSDQMVEQDTSHPVVGSGIRNRTRHAINMISVGANCLG
ncbi:hypothetical protein N7510_000253 [Penicillium lagena]|uniref:uncharacterized protein n=1 Tax=Penicillium lagena TaxID=94218 RepID=UPI0025402F8E|nr:uncharacterized protein N7510_000253 [Penicillium lagena]KAJ5623944.1 hypothetical protein N7510_000253 [Penicillium lagena]